MGTINYCTSEIVTLGYNTDYEIGEGYTEEDKEFQDEDSYYNAKFVLENSDKNFDWFNLNIEGGYYEGYYLKLEKRYETKYLDEEDKEEIRDEINNLEKLLEELLDSTDLTVCHPWWCTTYLNNEESKKEVKKSMNKLRSEINGSI